LTCLGNSFYYIRISETVWRIGWIPGDGGVLKLGWGWRREAVLPQVGQIVLHRTDLTNKRVEFNIVLSVRSDFLQKQGNQLTGNGRSIDIDGTITSVG
jgi:hypothetical protein